MRSALAGLGCLVISIVLFLPGLLGPVPGRPATGSFPRTGVVWTMAASSAGHLTRTVLSSDLDNSNTLIHQTAPTGERDWRSFSAELAVARFTCFSSVRGDCAAGTSFRAEARRCPGARCPIPRYVKAVAYDNERWGCPITAAKCLTPVREQKHPGYYMHRFCHLAHEKGWNCILEPAKDVVINDVGCSAGHHFDGFAGIAARYLRCIPPNVAKARPAAYVIQAQTFETGGRGTATTCNPRYASFVSKARDRAAAVYGGLTALSNLNPFAAGQSASATQLLSCWRSVYPGYVRGSYFTVTKAGGPTVSNFFTRLGKCAVGGSTCR